MVAVTLGGTLFLAVGQAQAVTCTHSASHTITNSTGVSHATFTISYGCSDGDVHMSGTIYDDKCDARAGIIQFEGGYVPGLLDAEWEYTAKAGNGCGTHSTFSGARSVPSVAVVYVDVRSCNSTSFPYHDDCSSDQTASYNV